jgi:hypothetical protein
MITFPVMQAMYIIMMKAIRKYNFGTLGDFFWLAQNENK